MLIYDSFTPTKILTLSQIGSTNHYAHQLIEQDTVEHGLCITALEQNLGKGQRGNTWYGGLPNEQLAASIIIKHSGSDVQHLFILNMAVALAVRELICQWLPTNLVHIKWSNDILVSNKKIGGILIENIIRGNHLSYSVIGIGLNINNKKFPEFLPLATSIWQHTQVDNSIKTITEFLLIHLNYYLQMAMHNPEKVIEFYNEHLYMMHQSAKFLKQQNIIDAIITGVNADGLLSLKLNGEVKNYGFGEIKQIIYSKESY